MLILSADQIRSWDHFTIQHEPISSIELMERAARQCVEWIKNRNWQNHHFRIYCGKGNNGGDGLAIARMLLLEGYTASVYILEFGKLGSPDFQTNLQRLHEILALELHFIQQHSVLPNHEQNEVIIDALYGSGLDRPLEGLSAVVVNHINGAGVPVVAIDLPSGLFADAPSGKNTIVRADFTLSFQCYKLGLLMQENAPYIGQVTILDIGLSKEFLNSVLANNHLLDEQNIRSLFKPRNKFAHKGTFGHALIIGGSYGKMGAAVLAIRACVHSGAGLTTAFIPKCGYQIIQTTIPESMVIVDNTETHLSNLPDDIEKFSSIGIGPGIGTSSDTQNLLFFIVRRFKKPCVIDADGLNCLAANKEWLSLLPSHSILTPHPKEFDRLFGEHENDFERYIAAKAKSAELNAIIVLKSHHSLIALPNGKCYFNTTGNAGMAKGGSGDVLTGIITAFLAQGYSPQEAALLGVYLHGWAGDFAAGKLSKESMLPGDMINCLSDVFLSLQ